MLLPCILYMRFHAFSCVSRGMKFLWSFFSTLLCNSYIMPTSCVVGGCTRNSITNPETHFYQFPRDPAISKEWVKFVNNTRKDFTFLARSRPLICSAHFSEDCRERSSALKESLGLKSKYRLKPGSIPTLKAPNIESIRASASTTTSTPRVRRPSHRPPGP